MTRPNIFNKKNNVVKNTGSDSPTINTMFNAYPSQILTGGYSTDMQMPTFPCLNTNQTSFEGNATVVTPFGSSVPFSQLLDELIVSTSSHDNLWIFSSNPSAVYANAANDTIYTQSFYFIETITVPTIAMTINERGTGILNPLGLGAYNAGLEQFRITCGNQVAIKEEMGAGLFVTLQLNFNHLADKETFNAQVTQPFDNMTSALNTIQTITAKDNIGGNLEFMVFQSGADPTQLAQILSKNPATGNYYLTTCSFSDITDCQGALNSVLAYSEKPFQSQVGFANGQIVGNAVPRDFIYANYTDYGLNATSSIVTPDIQAARSQLTAVYEATQTQEILINKLLSSEIANYIVNDVSAILSSMVVSIGNNLAVISNPINGITGCYTSPQNCLAIAANINAQLMPVNENELNELISVFQNGYSVSNLIGYDNFNYLPIGDNIYIPIPPYDTQHTAFFGTPRVIQNNESVILVDTTPILGTNPCSNSLVNCAIVYSSQNPLIIVTDAQPGPYQTSYDQIEKWIAQGGPNNHGGHSIILGVTDSEIF